MQSFSTREWTHKREQYFGPRPLQPKKSDRLFSSWRKFLASDHKIIEFCFRENPPKTQKSQNLTRNLQKGNFEKINHEILNGEIKRLLIKNFSTNEKYQVFSTEIEKLFNKFVPLKPINKIINDNYTEKIKNLSNEKLKLHRKLKANPNHGELKTQYLVISRELKKQLKIFHDKKEENIISKCKMALHKYVKNKLGTDISIPNLIDQEGKVHTNNGQKP